MGKTRHLFKEIGGIKGTFHARMDKIKNRNDKDITKAEKIKRRWQEELYKKFLNDPGNHNDVVIHLEPVILECQVKWTLESITMNKASGSDEIPAELFKILKDGAVKVLHSTCQQIFKKLSSGHRTGKDQFSFQSLRKAMLNNIQTIVQLCLFHILAR